MKRLLTFCACFAALLLAALGAQAQQLPSPLIGSWIGPISVNGMTLHLVVHFTAKPDGTLAATADSPDQDATGIPFSVCRVNGTAVHLEAAAIGAAYDGVLDPASKTIVGHWMQGGSSFPLIISKTDQPTVPQMVRPQEPRPPFSYAVRDVAYPGGAPGVTISGTLTMPQGKGPFPAVLLISGSGPNNRDEQVLGHKPFLLLADTLTRRGIAVLRYDKRGVGKSTGSYAKATSADFAQDAAAGVAYLRTQSAINQKSIGLLGHSEGGLIAPMVAAAHPTQIAFVVLLAAPGMTGEKILLAQSDLIARADGASAQELAQNDALQRRLFAIVSRQPNQVLAQQQAQAAILKTFSGMSPADKAQIPDPKAYAKAQVAELNSPWMRYFLAFDPRADLQKTRCPVLAIDGSKDLQVPPAEDLSRIANALHAGGNSQVTIKEFPNLNHLFQTCKTGSPTEYAQIEETMAPVALATIADWIVAHAASGAAHH